MRVKSLKERPVKHSETLIVFGGVASEASAFWTKVYLVSGRSRRTTGGQ